MQQPFITGKQPMFGGRSIFVLNPSQKTLQHIWAHILKDNESLDKISKFTGLSQDEIVELKNKL